MKTKPQPLRPRSLLDPDFFSKGGPGSGNFGHAGRPGERGGSAPRGGSAEPTPEERSAHAIADNPHRKELLERAQKLKETAIRKDPEITGNISKAVAAAGGEMKGLEHRVKENANRTAEKMAERIDQGMTPAQAQDAIYDSLRYTGVYDASSYTANVQQTIDSMKAAGYTVYDHKDKNYWSDPPGLYQGMNYVFEDRDGFKFEMQFHTKESAKIKDQIHKSYQELRSTKDPLRTKEIKNFMSRLWASVPFPRNVQGVGTVVQLSES